MIHIGIIGGGFVGGATSLLSSAHVNTIVYDLDPKRCKPEGTTFDDILKTEGVFICVWTPITVTEEEYGKCNTSLVESIIKKLRDNMYKGYIIVRSTVEIILLSTSAVYITYNRWNMNNIPVRPVNNPLNS